MIYVSVVEKAWAWVRETWVCPVSAVKVQWYTWMGSVTSQQTSNG